MLIQLALGMACGKDMGGDTAVDAAGWTSATLGSPPDVVPLSWSEFVDDADDFTQCDETCTDLSDPACETANQNCRKDAYLEYGTGLQDVSGGALCYGWFDLDADRDGFDDEDLFLLTGIALQGWHGEWQYLDDGTTLSTATEDVYPAFATVAFDGYEAGGLWFGADAVTPGASDGMVYDVYDSDYESGSAPYYEVRWDVGEYLNPDGGWHAAATPWNLQWLYEGWLLHETSSGVVGDTGDTGWMTGMTSGSGDRYRLSGCEDSVDVNGTSVELGVLYPCLCDREPTTDIDGELCPANLEGNDPCLQLNYMPDAASLSEYASGDLYYEVGTATRATFVWGATRTSAESETAADSDADGSCDDGACDTGGIGAAGDIVFESVLDGDHLAYAPWTGINGYGQACSAGSGTFYAYPVTEIQPGIWNSLVLQAAGDVDMGGDAYWTTIEVESLGNAHRVALQQRPSGLRVNLSQGARDLQHGAWTLAGTHLQLLGEGLAWHEPVMLAGSWACGNRASELDLDLGTAWRFASPLESLGIQQDFVVRFVEVEGGLAAVLEVAGRLDQHLGRRLDETGENRWRLDGVKEGVTFELELARDEDKLIITGHAAGFTVEARGRELTW